MSRKQLVFATNNPHKIAEVKELLGTRYDFLSLADIDCHVELPETQDTLEGNARQKARYVKEHFGMDCFAEDTGLEVTALHGEPGVRTARYAGESREDLANMAKVLGKLTGSQDRSARFRTVIALALGSDLHLFEGRVEGHIAEAGQGDGGFGYDPIFVPSGEVRTFAQMSGAEKHRISHRGRAVQKLTAFLTNINIE